MVEGLVRRRPGAARRLVTFLARPRKPKVSVEANLLADYAGAKTNQKKAAPGVAPPLRGGNLVLPASMRRLRNSTWQGTQNVPCHGTRTVLADNPLPGRAARRDTWGNKSKQRKDTSVRCAPTQHAVPCCFRRSVSQALFQPTRRIRRKFSGIRELPGRQMFPAGPAHACRCDPGLRLCGFAGQA